MRIKIGYIVFLGTFMLMLLVPLAFVNLYGGIASEQENRMLAARPPISDMFNHPVDFIRQFDNWFTDNVGFRGNLINLYKKLDVLETQGQYTDGQYIMLIGQQGHHYFAGVNGCMINKFQGKPYLTDYQLSGLTDGLNNIQAYLNSKDIPLIVMFCVDKETIYPEYYPSSIIRGPEPIQLDIISEYVKSNTTIDFFNIKDSLLAAKENYPVFDKVGDAANILSHYNEIGAFFAYQELMKHINTYMPQIEPFTIDDVNITYDQKAGFENIPDVTLKQDIAYHRLDSSFFDGVNLHLPSQGVAFENDNPSLPTILFIRDSYTGDGTYLSRYIPQHFGKTILIHWENMVFFEEYIDRFHPDIVVFESAERTLDGFASTVINYNNR